MRQCFSKTNSKSSLLHVTRKINANKHHFNLHVFDRRCIFYVLHLHIYMHLELIASHFSNACIFSMTISRTVSWSGTMAQILITKSNTFLRLVYLSIFSTVYFLFLVLLLLFVFFLTRAYCFWILCSRSIHTYSVETTTKFTLVM